jgi:hypothetical protein
MRSLVVVSVVLLAAAPALAQDSRAVKKIEDINRAAMEDYDILNFESAKKLLEGAETQIKKAKLDKHPVAARTQVNLGIVLGGGLGDMAGAQAAFKRALEIDPQAKLPTAYRTPELQRVLDAAGSKAPDEGPPVGLKHTPIESAKSGEAIPVSVQVGAEVKAKQIVVSYRAAGTQEFTALPMKPVGVAGAEWTASIPGDATRGDAVDYFIEARGTGGKVLAATGNASSPSTIRVARAGTPTPPVEKPEEDPLELEPDVPKPKPEPEEPRVRKRRIGYVNVGVGTGAGFISGKTEVSDQDVTCCVAFAPFHVMAELGFYLTPSFTLSLAGRFGLPLGANVPEAATAAPSGFLRATYHFGLDRGFYVHGAVGGGFIRHVVTLKRTSATGSEGQVDTFATGPLFVGAGGGYRLALGDMFRIDFDVSLYAGLPVIKEIGSGGTAITPGFAVHGDFTLGFGVVF